MTVCSASPVLTAYAKLRLYASAQPPDHWEVLRSMGPISAAATSISKPRAYRLAALLLLFDFHVGDLIRWLGGVYTHEHIPLDPIRTAVAALRRLPRRRGYPVQDYDRALHLLEHGAPVTAAYACSRADLAARNLYDNHAGISDHGPAVLAKIISGCNNHFVLVFPRWIWRFIYGLFLSPIGFLLQKGKGRIVVDPSTRIHDDGDSGALNDHMDKKNTTDVPRTFYASAQRRHWAHIWNLRITHPRKEILLYKDDINSAFHRGRYHPDIAAAFAYVWGEWLIIAIGLIFGARNSPGWFCILSELRADIAANYEGLQEAPLHHLVRKINIPENPSGKVAATFSPAEADAINPGTTATTPTHHATFVDDNLMAEIQARIRLSIQRSSDSCYMMFGHPERGILTPSLSEEKFVASAAWRMDQLGLDIDTRRMLVIYPLPKRTALLACIDAGWAPGALHTQREVATLLGHTRTASTILPLGSYFSIRIQQWLNACLAKLDQALTQDISATARTRAVWRTAKRFRVPSTVAGDIEYVRQLLLSPAADTIWSRPIGLLIPRTPHMTSLTDASYEGLGGWCTAFDFKWRISSSDLASLGWPVLTAEPERYKPLPQGMLHINVLEFIAVFINTWLAIRILLTRDLPPGGWVLRFRADNTSALGWMAHASRTRRPAIQNLARAYAALLTFAAPSSFTVSSDHIPGVDNDAADALSRPDQFPTWSSATKISPELTTLTAYRIPSELLSHLLWLVSSPQTGAQLETTTSALLSLGLTTLSVGAKNADSQTSLSRAPRKRRRPRCSQRTRKTSRKAPV